MLDGDLTRDSRPVDSMAASSSAGSSHTPVSSSPATMALPQGVMLPPGIHPAVYHSMLTSHYAMQGLRPPAVTTQHLAGLQQQFAQMFAASSVAPSSKACPVTSSAMGVVPSTAAIAAAAASAAAAAIANNDQR